MRENFHLDEVLIEIGGQFGLNASHQVVESAKNTGWETVAAAKDFMGTFEKFVGGESVGVEDLQVPHLKYTLVTYDSDYLER